MIALDNNILVHAHRKDSSWHQPAVEAVRTLAESAAEWAIPWPVMHEFLAIVTHPGIFSPPTPAEAAIDQVEAWLESPSLVLLSESADHWKSLRDCMLAGKISGPRVHDARIAALCLDHGIDELWTADRDFSRFPALKTHNPVQS